jgi:hypothetical protein
MSRKNSKKSLPNVFRGLSFVFAITSKSRGEIMAFWSKWFGGGESKPAAVAQSVEYKGFLIEATPFKDGGQWQLAGRITKDGKEHKFIRADKFTSSDDAAEIAISKGQLIVDQSGDRIFS